MPISVINDAIEIKLISNPEDIEYYSDLITRRHYLGSSAITRNTLVHVAKRGREEIAVITWEPKTRHWFGLRDRLIGWSASQRNERKKYCVENRRFLMLVEGKNLASKVLSGSMERLKSDGPAVYGYPFMLAETFVDPSRGYDGTCYKAAGWAEVGLTQGGRGERARSKKLYFVKELQKDALEKLRSVSFSVTDLERPKHTILTLERLNLPSLRATLESVPDYRKHKGWYPLSSIFALSIAAVLAGATRVTEIHRWVSTLSQELLRNLGCRRTPSYCMFWRTLRETDHALLSQALYGWLSTQVEQIYIDRSIRILSLDGKHIRTASKSAGTDIQVLSLIDTISKVVIDQRIVPSNGSDKTNEIPVAQELLSSTPLDAQTIVTADALHSQRKTAAIVEKKTPNTSCRSRITNQISKKQSSKTPQKKIGRYNTILQSLHTEE